jgi:hypothetical protein
MADNIPIEGELPSVLEIDISREGRKFVARTLSELQAWVQSEQQFWLWLQQAKGEDNSLEAFLFFYQQEKPITRTLSAVMGTELSELRRQHLETLRTHLADRYTKGLFPTAESPIAQFAAQLAKKDKVQAAHALWALLGNAPLISQHPARALRGQLLSVVYDFQGNALTESQAAAWGVMQARATSEQSALRAEAGSLSDEFRDLSSQIRSLHEQQKRSFDEQHAARSAEFKTTVAGHTTTMDNIQGTFKRELSLRSAVEYLSNKADDHHSTAKTAGTAAAIVGLVVVALAVAIARLVFTDSTVPVPQVAVAVLSATLAFWLLRILVRVLLSSLHLETDMRARSTFVHTYLALLAEGGGIKDEDRALVIGLVFRPISDGLVRDDATPPGLWDLITKNLSGRTPS